MGLQGNELEGCFEVQALYFIFLKHYPGYSSLQPRATLSYQLPYNTSCFSETDKKRSPTRFTQLVERGSELIEKEMSMIFDKKEHKENLTFVAIYVKYDIQLLCYHDLYDYAHCKCYLKLYLLIMIDDLENKEYQEPKESS